MASLQQTPMAAELDLDERGLEKQNALDGLDDPHKFICIQVVVGQIIGLLVATGIYALNRTAADKKINMLKVLNLGWLYLSVVVLNFIVPSQLAYVLHGRKESRVENPDQYVYEVVGKPELPFVRLVSNGPLGAFNRAQRAVNNSRETFAFHLAYTLLAGFVYPEVVFVLSVMNLGARVVYSRRYIQNREHRMPALNLSQMLLSVLGGLILFSGIMSFF